MGDVKMKIRRLLAVLLALALVLVIGISSTVLAAPAAPQAAQGDRSLMFDVNNFTLENVVVGTETVEFRAYRNVVYVKNPTESWALVPVPPPGTVIPKTVYQKMNVYVPVDIPLDEYKTDASPIFLPNTIGGYMPGLPAEPTSVEVKAALAKGYVVVAPGARGRTNYDDAGAFTGKAPALIVDLKAAVRYLRFNDKVMPGSAEKIVSSGISAGGAASALLGATGNNKDYEPYLLAVGAARARDDIFATNAYCPITNLDNADAAYEWMFYGVNDYSFLGGGTMKGDQLVVSTQLKDLFPSYVNGLRLYTETGKSRVYLRLFSNGEGSFKRHVTTFIVDSAQTALAKGTDLSAYSWISIENGVVKAVDFDDYVKYVKRMKPAPAFDGIGAPSWENSEFGTATTDNQHFTAYSATTTYSTWQAPLADAQIVKMLNPMYYIGTAGTTSSHYWRIRHGAIDADTTVAIPVILATKLMNTGHDVDFAVPWGQKHGGNYDLEELFAWIEAITK